MDGALAEWKFHHGINDEAFFSLQQILAAYSPHVTTNVWGSWNDMSAGSAVIPSTTNFHHIPGMPEVLTDKPVESNLSEMNLAFFTSQHIDENDSIAVSSASVDAEVVPSEQAAARWKPIKSRERKPQCIPCWRMKKACNPPGDSQCARCSKQKLPMEICVKVRFADEPIFSKWANTTYSSKLGWEELSWIGDSRPIALGHRIGGPMFEAACCQFNPSTTDQIHLYWKGRKSWRMLKTTPFGIKDQMVELDAYVVKWMHHNLSGIDPADGLIGQALSEAKGRIDEPLVRLSLKLWTANGLLMKGWELVGTDTLGVDMVADCNCPMFGTFPAPRVLQNQLDRCLESYIAHIESRLLRMLQNAMQRRITSPWLSQFLAVVIILHVLERDIWRLLYWILHAEEAYKWRHPQTPTDLIQKSLSFSDLLLMHVRYAGGVPEEFVLEKELSRTFTQNASPFSLYREDREDSIDRSLSSLALMDKGLARNVGFRVLN